jgi:hypothetical protein
MKMKIPAALVFTSVFFILLGAARLGAASDSEGKLVSQWKLSNFDAGEVKNKIPAGGGLSVGSPEAPKLAEEVGLKGLLFGEGEYLVGKSKDIPLLGGFGEAGQPFSVRMVIVPLKMQIGSYGGLFQAMVYTQKGFRLVINQGRKLGVETFSNDEVHGFSGETVLSFGTVYTVELRFDGTKAILLLDGKPDGELEMGLPVPYAGGFQIGTVSGADCFFNGIIGEVSIFALKP